jgi:hypothetical protein
VLLPPPALPAANETTIPVRQLNATTVVFMTCPFRICLPSAGL